ncbi:hypothetical protein [Mesorhizobium loti]|nr:hypothetical protein [Mesorhizobium loti]
MNLRRGLFRVWVLITIAWFVAVGAFAYSTLQHRPNRMPVATRIMSGDKPVVEMLCSEARGKLGTDFSTSDTGVPGPWDDYTKLNVGTRCYYLMPAYRATYPEYASLSDDQLFGDYGLLSGVSVNPWPVIWRILVVGVSGSLALLLVGWLVLWAGAGFAKPRQPPPA